MQHLHPHLQNHICQHCLYPYPAAPCRLPAAVAASASGYKSNPSGADDVLAVSATARPQFEHSFGSSTVQACNEHVLPLADSAAARPGRRRRRHRAPRLPYVLACMADDDIAMQRIAAETGAPSAAADADLSQALQELHATVGTTVDAVRGVVWEGGKRRDDIKRTVDVTAMWTSETEVRLPAD